METDASRCRFREASFDSIAWSLSWRIGRIRAFANLSLEYVQATSRSSEHGSLVIGCRPRRAFWRDAQLVMLNRRCVVAGDSPSTRLVSFEARLNYNFPGDEQRCKHHRGSQRHPDSNELLPNGIHQGKAS
jgi:hypothetical protein